MSKDWSSYVCVRNPETGKIVCVRRIDPETGKPRGPWHLPGGKKDHTDVSWVRTAIGELKEEVGIEVREDQIRFLEKKHRRIRRKMRHHNYTSYYAEVTGVEAEQFANRELRTSDEEEVAEFSPRRIRAMKNFSRAHKRILHAHGLLRTRNS